MKSGKILPLLLSVLSLLIIDGAKAQTVSKVSLVAKGAFELDGNYPKGRDGKALLNPFSDKSHEYALEKLTDHGVKVTFGVAVTKVGPESVELSDGSTLPTRTVIWGGGESASPVAASTGATPGRGGRIDVEPDLSVPGFDGVFAVGDIANIPGADGRALPQLGSVAQQSGKWAGKNIAALIVPAGRPPEFLMSAISDLINSL